MVPFEQYLSLPLLPHEKQLIEVLGLTAEEYRAFTREVIWRSRERPAAYDHIPEVVGEGAFWTAVAVSLLVGGLTTAASYFLTPKPEAPQASRIRNRQLDNIVGRDRFSPTYGFQSNQDISRYGEAVPIVFTRQLYDPVTKTYTGGVMVSPKLVWSRMFSWGTYQTADLVFLVSQGPMPRGPYSTDAEKAADRAGLYFGQSPVDALPPSDYTWFYYSGGSVNANGLGYATDSRLLGRHSRYGELLSTNPIPDSDNAFYAPTFAGGDSEAFCHVYSPSAQLRFGVFAGIPNGTPYRLNWEIVPRLDDYDDNAKRQANARRLQICGNFKMAGTGRNYPRRIGVFKYNDSEIASNYAGNDGIAVSDINVGDRVTILFGGPRIAKDLWWDDRVYDPKKDGDKVSVKSLDDNDSVNSEIAGELEQYDDQLQPGTRFVIGNCMFRVEKRTPTEAFYRRKQVEFEVVLICEEVYDDGYVPNGKGRVGFVPKDFVLSKTPMPERSSGSEFDISQSWYPVCQAEVATFQNVRECDTTEIGIKSQVWLRFNGLTNIISLPSEDQLKEFDDDNINIKAGTIQTYSTRTSFFSIYVRPANAGPNDKWTRLNKYPLCVRGTAPRDQYNFVRVGHPKGQYEFRLRPHNSGEITRIIGRTNKCFQISPSAPFVRTDTNVPFSSDPFVLYAKGIEATISDFALSNEMINKEGGSTGGGNTVTSYTVSLVRADIPSQGRQATAKEISNGLTKTISKDPDRDASEDIYPNIPWSGIAEGGFYTFTDAESDLFTIGGAFKLRMQLQSYLESGPYNNSREWFWRIVNIGAVSIDDAAVAKVTDGQTFQVTKTLIDGRSIVYTFRVNVTQTRTPVTYAYERIFEANTAISEVSHYGGLITRSCDSNPEHEIVYVGESISRGKNATYAGCAMAGIKIRSSRNFNQLEQLRLYQKNGINVPRFIMEAGRVERNLGVGPSNLFTDLIRYLLSDQQTGLGAIYSDTLIDETELRRTAMFLNANRLFYDDVLTEPVNIREFVARIAPSLLCNMVTRGGKFSIEPAIPFHDDGQIVDGVNLQTVPFSAIFTEGNIIEDSFELRYLNAEERKPMRASIRYRSEYPNRFPEERTVIVAYNDDPTWANAPLEEFDFSHITSLDHAVMVGKYFLSIRRRVRHTVSFKTSPYGISLAPGNYIRVITESNIYDPLMNNGAILDDGTIVSVDPLADGTYDVFLWLRSVTQVVETDLQIQNGQSPLHRNALFAIRNNTSNNLSYVVESLQLDQDGLVQIVASQFPVDDNAKSLIAKDVSWLNSNIFTLETSA